MNTNKQLRPIWQKLIELFTISEGVALFAILLKCFFDWMVIA